LSDQEWIGSSSADVFCGIVRADKRVESVTFVAPPRKVSLQGRVVGNPRVDAAVEEALRIKSERDIPFWDAMFVAAQKKDLPRELWSEAMYHRSPSEFVRDVRVDDIGPELIDELASRVPEGRALAISSEVRGHDGNRRHVPMLDLRWQPSDRNLEIVVEVIKASSLRGFIVNSGHSYHFYGSELINAPELPAFLGRSLLWGPMIDRRWVAHQLIEGACALRIAPRNPMATDAVPRVVATVESGLDAGPSEVLRGN
jgi:hypothetical protein